MMLKREPIHSLIQHADAETGRTSNQCSAHPAFVIEQRLKRHPISQHQHRRAREMNQTNRDRDICWSRFDFDRLILLHVELELRAAVRDQSESCCEQGSEDRRKHNAELQSAVAAQPAPVSLLQHMTRTMDSLLRAREVPQGPVRLPRWLSCLQGVP